MDDVTKVRRDEKNKRRNGQITRNEERTRRRDTRSRHKRVSPVITSKKVALHTHTSDSTKYARQSVEFSNFRAYRRRILKVDRSLLHSARGGERHERIAFHIAFRYIPHIPFMPLHSVTFQIWRVGMGTPDFVQNAKKKNKNRRQTLFSLTDPFATREEKKIIRQRDDK